MQLSNLNMQLKEVANGVVNLSNGKFYPYRTAVLTPAVAPGTTIKATSGNQRLYWKSIYLIGRTIAADTTTYVQARMYSSDNSKTFGACTLSFVPNVAQAHDFGFKIGMLGDLDSYFLLLCDAVPTFSRGYFIYAEVDDL